MTPLPLKDWQFGLARLVFQEIEAPEFWGQPDMEDAEVEGMKAEDVKKEIKDVYGPESFQAALQAYLDKYFPKEGDQEVREDLLGLADEYRKAFEGPDKKGGLGIYGLFLKEIDDLNDAYEDTIESIVEHTETALEELSARINAERRALKKPDVARPLPPYVRQRDREDPEIQILPTPDSLAEGNLLPHMTTVETSAQINRREAMEKTQRSFQEYLSARLDSLMDKDLRESDLGKRLRQGIGRELKGQIAYFFEQNQANKDTLTQLQKNLEEQLKGYSGLDGNPGNLSMRDAALILNDALTSSALKEILNRGPEERDMRKLEQLYILSPSAWIQAVASTTQLFMEDTVKNGNEQAFVDLVNDYAMKKGDRVEKWEEAKGYFAHEMALRAQAGPKETLAMLDDLNRAINADRVAILQGIEPTSIAPLVYREREQLIDGVNVPTSASLKAVVDFIQAEREGREAILKNPGQREALFYGIRIIDRDYREYYDENSDNLPEETRQLTSNPNASKPTGHDKLARAKALVMLAEEATWVVKNYETLKGFKGLGDELDSTEIEETPVKLELDFNNVNALSSLNYVSMASEGGFNGKELGLSVVKGVAIFTVFINGVNALHHGGIEAALSNPFMYAGLGVAYGITKYRENADVVDVLGGSPGTKAKEFTFVQLNSLYKKRGDGLRRFIGTPVEWKAMGKLDPTEAAEKVRAAKERNPKEPRITNKDLEGVVDEDLLYLLPPANDQERYYFYSSFITGKHNIRQLQEHCQEWL